jgi:hypothetical protein
MALEQTISTFYEALKNGFCKGPYDERLFSCQHEWIKEVSPIDDKTYYFCPHCNLICKVALGEKFPEECKFERMMQSLRRKQILEHEMKKCKTCECKDKVYSREKSQHEQGCSECEFGD